MPAPSIISTLPPDLRTEFEKEIVNRGFADYAGLVLWLKERGYQISRTSAHRHGQRLKRNLEALKTAVEQAAVLAETVKDDGGNFGAALTGLAQLRLYDILAEDNITEDALPKLIRAIADINRTAISQKKWQAEVRAKLKTKFNRLEKDAASNKSKQDPVAMVKKIREEIYGLF